MTTFAKKLQRAQEAHEGKVETARERLAAIDSWLESDDGFWPEPTTRERIVVRAFGEGGAR